MRFKCRSSTRQYLLLKPMKLSLRMSVPNLHGQGRQDHRKGMPNDSKGDKVLKRSDSDWRVFTKEVICLKWMDRKSVLSLGSYHNPVSVETASRRENDGTREDVSCPTMVTWVTLTNRNAEVSKEYLSNLEQKIKRTKPPIHFKVNGLVLLKEDNLSPVRWELRRITKLYPGSDSKVRVAVIKIHSGVFRRGVVKLCSLVMQEAI
ncbi:hypothetical protein ILUMI_14140 [Ignelater luminosus]|uniref:DUF5641 domain-containing protein n=1 Tax=Ignelater luminosus TaxID=2038154 RepID=A0A8K0GB81_IGNLU|nr:hypothetical protein ILUMI_14140 [Ignelater luminosus]